jgi:hypothetical protein
VELRTSVWPETDLRDATSSDSSDQACVIKCCRMLRSDGTTNYLPHNCLWSVKTFAVISQFKV